MELQTAASKLCYQNFLKQQNRKHEFTETSTMMTPYKFIQ